MALTSTIRHPLSLVLPNFPAVLTRSKQVTGPLDWVVFLREGLSVFSVSFLFVAGFPGGTQLES